MAKKQIPIPVPTTPQRHSGLDPESKPPHHSSTSPRHSGPDPESSASLASSERSEHGRQEPIPVPSTPPRHSGLDPESKPPQSWQHINELLKRLAELTVRKRELENKKTELISEITASFDSDAAPVLDEMKRIEDAVLEYVTDHKDEFAKNRTKELSHGTISMRISTSVRVLSRAACIRALESLNMHEYIKVTKNPNKEMLSVLSDVELARVSCEKKVTDNITIAPKIEEILDTAATRQGDEEA
ncbi:MAG TPA: host-nuclease inhibitor Gam family protein [Candidatus Syntrophosphaera sp.]|jgi:phage host-nuclease inhibitor protein Gam|nr:host-nuclease inhibitor Gam family protein [Candidatus Syntrophosphaera sp.]